MTIFIVLLNMLKYELLNLVGQSCEQAVNGYVYSSS